MPNEQTIELLVRGRYVVSDPADQKDGILKDGAVAVSGDGTIADVGSYDELKKQYPRAEKIGSSDDLVMPGMIDAHSHGMGLTYFELGAGYDHLEYWNTIIPTIERPDRYLDSLWCAMKHIRSGCTTIHHMSGASSIAQAAKAYDEIGIRSAYCPTVKDKNLLTYDDEKFFEELPKNLRKKAEEKFRPDPTEVAARYEEEFMEIFEEYDAVDSPVGLGPMGPQWCTSDLLVWMRDKAEELNINIHMHGVQTPYQNDSIIRSEGKTSVEYLHDLDILGSNLTIGHGVWISQKDLELLAETNTSMTHHPGCNLHMRNGILPLEQLIKNGVNVAVAVDGKAINDDEDIIAEMRLAEKLHRVANLQPGSSILIRPAELLKMTTTNAAALLGLDQICGRLKKGMAADIAVVDMTPDPYVDPAVSVVDQLVMQKSRRDVKTVIADGEIVMRDGEILNIDEEQLFEELVKSISADDDAHDKKALLDELRTHILDHYTEIEPLPQCMDPFYAVNRKRN